MLPAEVGQAAALSAPFSSYIVNKHLRGITQYHIFAFLWGFDDDFTIYNVPQT